MLISCFVNFLNKVPGNPKHEQPVTLLECNWLIDYQNEYESEHTKHR